MKTVSYDILFSSSYTKKSRKRVYAWVIILSKKRQAPGVIT